MVGVLERVQSDVRSLCQVVIAFVVLYAFGVVDEVLRRVVGRFLADYWETKVKFAAMSVWLGSGRVELDGVRVENWRGFSRRKEAAVEMWRASVYVDFFSLRQKVVLVEKAKIGKLRLVLMRRKDGTLNVEFFAKKRRLQELPKSDSSDEEAEDGWVDVTKALPSVATKSTANQLWNLLSSGLSEAEARMRSNDERGVLEDAALYALDAAERAKTEVASATDQARKWARDRARSSLKEALRVLFERADQQQRQEQERAAASSEKNTEKKRWSLAFSAEAIFEVDEFVVELMDARCHRLIDPPLVFLGRVLRDLAFSGGEKMDDDNNIEDPARVVLRLGRLLAQSCVEDLVDRRPDDALRLARAIARQLADDTTRVAKDNLAKLASHALDALSMADPAKRLADASTSFADRSDDEDSTYSWPSTNGVTTGESF